MSQRSHALLLGGGMAGLLVARVLTDRYTRVTVVDRDDLTGGTGTGAGTDTPANGKRRGVPHGQHIHALLARGQQALEELFPGLTEELISDGAPYGDMQADTQLYFSGCPMRRTHSALPMLSFSRP
jgi:2-polyprenyl-6-methoxyphenol hydroxylase-like FAD-dependent oxidoreductase